MNLKRMPNTIGKILYLTYLAGPGDWQDEVLAIADKSLDEIEKCFLQEVEGEALENEDEILAGLHIEFFTNREKALLIKDFVTVALALLLEQC